MRFLHQPPVEKNREDSYTAINRLKSNATGTLTFEMPKEFLCIYNHDPISEKEI